MNEQPTPETDAEVTSYFEKKHPPIVCYHELAKFARRLERERDEAREKLTAERALTDKLTQWIVDWRAGFGGEMPDKNCDCVDCETLIAVDEFLNTTKNRPSED